MTADSLPNRNLAADITFKASKQTYYTMRWLADKERVQQGLAAYAYLRWVDDRLDTDIRSNVERLRFIGRQQSLVAALTGNKPVGNLSPEENLLAELVTGDTEKESGLRSYLQHMMQIMAFDTKRRGRLSSLSELDNYTHHLAVGVTELLHYLIGSKGYSPKGSSRYAAASAAHIVHMLRDTYEDLDSGYFNVPQEVLVKAGITPTDIQHPAYLGWVSERIQLASEQFRIARNYLSRVESLRCRLAGYTYMNRFETVLELITKDNFVLRRQYPKRRTLGSLATFASSLLASLLRGSGPQSAMARVSKPRESENI